MTSSLNQGQQEAADAFFQFLFSDDPEFAISGPGGVGKTHLMSQLIDKIIPDYRKTCGIMGLEPRFEEVHMTATTNKAAEVLAVATQRPTSTIHSHMNLKVLDDYSTGRSKVTPNNNWRVHHNQILFIDECSMIDSPLLEYLHKGTIDSKIVYVGDHCQLAPVMERVSPVYSRTMPFVELTEQMRTNNPYLQAINDQLRLTVETGVFYPIRVVPGSIDLLDEAQMQAELELHFKEQSLDRRILAWSNKQVNAFNDYIRELRQLPTEYTRGEFLVNNQAIQLRRTMLPVEAEVTIGHQDPDIEQVFVEDNVFLDVRRTDLITRSGGIFENVPVPVDRHHHAALIAYYKRLKKWPIYYNLRNNYPDLRQRDAATVHKSQGSTYDTVYIDLGNISTCHQPDQVARMLYVAFSRARTRVCLYGNLASKYGGLIT